MLKPLKLGIWGVFFFTIAIVWAEKADREQPLYIESQTAKIDQKVKKAIFSEKVDVKQGTLQLLADEVTVDEDSAGFHEVKGHGSPVRFKQKMDGSEAILQAKALRFHYVEKSGILTLYEQAWVKKGEDEVLGDIIIYNTHQEIYQAQTEAGKRVNVMITPKKKGQDNESAR